MTVSTVREQGRVKWFNPTKGFGFARPDSGSEKDVFLHVNQLPDGIDTLREDQLISYVPETTRKGIRAANIQLV